MRFCGPVVFAVLSLFDTLFGSKIAYVSILPVFPDTPLGQEPGHWRSYILYVGCDFAHNNFHFHFIFMTGS